MKAVIRPRDFIETKEGLIFAAICQNKAFLRYYPDPMGERIRLGRSYKKVTSTELSNSFLEKNFPHHLIKKGGRYFQRCPPESILKIYRPEDRLRNLKKSSESLSLKCLKLNEIFESVSEKNKGVTGSILVDLSVPSSDIDFVIYGNKEFDEARSIIRDHKKTFSLNRVEWSNHYKKRFPQKPDLTFNQFLAHEKRKHSIGMIDGTKFTLLLVGDRIKIPDSTPLKKIKIRCIVKDVSQAFNIPSVYNVEHELVDTVVSYTHTYAGQALKGEEIEVSGTLEKTKKADYLLVVGTTQEVSGEYIRSLGVR